MMLNIPHLFAVTPYEVVPTRKAYKGKIRQRHSRVYAFVLWFVYVAKLIITRFPFVFKMYRFFCGNFLLFRNNFLFYL